MTSSRAKRDPKFQAMLDRMALSLAPMVSLDNGAISKEYPKTLLNFWLLTSEQLDELARFYHQRTPCFYTNYYPCPIEWKTDLPLEAKRMKFGRFIGLRGCETPVRIMSEDEILEEARKARISKDEEMCKGAWY